MPEKQAILPLIVELTNEELPLAQQIIISASGQILETDNTLFNFSALGGTKITVAMDFLNVIFADILQIELGDDDLVFPKVNFEFQEKKGLFHFRFCKMCYQNEIAIVWTITPVVEDTLYNQAQQTHHEQTMLQEQSSFLSF
jgi:hypothetical protein